jgi:hypothetical protein
MAKKDVVQPVTRLKQWPKPITRHAVDEAEPKPRKNVKK